MDKFFNTAGPIIPDDHYHLPVLARMADSQLLQLIAKKRYFVLHAPRQTGKTSVLLGLCEQLNAGSDYDAVYINVEGAQGFREDINAALEVIVGTLTRQAEALLDDEDLAAVISASQGSGPSLEAALSALSVRRSRPVVLFIDEIDSLIGDTLITVLRQIRAGYTQRPERFPISLVLCGVRDIRDYRIHSSRTQEIVTGGSCFNIKAVSLRLADFTEPESRALLAQHTETTGQVFSEEALDLMWHYSEGQPWLVNALADECCFTRHAEQDRSVSISGEMMESAKDRLVASRSTHLHQLTDKLKEPRVYRVMAPLVAGQTLGKDATAEDFDYVVDLGLIRRGPQGLVIANAIYREVIPRELTFVSEVTLESTLQRHWFIRDDGTLNMDKLLTDFVAFFRENSESWVERFQYKEAGPQLLLQAFLQRIVNGGGRIDREYGLGRRRTDLLVRWPTTEASWHGPVERFVIELKLLHKSLEATTEAGIKQTADYMQRTGMSETLGHLVIFDRREDVAWDDKVYTRQVQGPGGERIKIWGC